MKLTSRLKRWAPAEPEFLLLLFMAAVYPLVVAPHSFQIYGSFQDYFYLPRFLLLALAAGLALVLMLRERVKVEGRELIPLGAFLLFILISAALAADPLTAWVGAPLRFTGVLTYLFCMILFILAARGDLSPRLLPFMAGAAAVVSALALLQVFGLNLVPHEPFRRMLTAYGTLGNPDYFGVYAAFILPAACHLYLRERKPLRLPAGGRLRRLAGVIIGERRPLWLLAGGVIYLGLLASFTVGAWTGALAGLTLLAVFSWRPEHKRALLRLALNLLVLTLVFAALAAGLGLADKVGLVSPLERLGTIEKTAELFLRCWDFGVGPDHLTHVVQMMPYTPLMDKTPNMYLEMAVTMGAFAALAYLAFLGFVLKGRRDELGAMAAAYLVAGLFHFEVMVVMPLFWILLGSALARKARPVPAPQAEGVAQGTPGAYAQA